ncbi:MAG: DUF1893 domain-containing protein [Alkaliphilus sp.]
MQGLNIAKIQLKEMKYTCVIVKHGDVIKTSHERGIKPIFSILETNKKSITGASLADKVIGKAAALLLILGEIREVYADVISEDALKVLLDNNIYVEYTIKVPFIVNRESTGRCPMEVLVYNVAEPKVAFDLICEKLASIKILSEEKNMKN